MRIYDADATRIDGGPPFPADQQVIERLERSGGVFDYGERLTVRVGHADGQYAYAVAEPESPAAAAATLRNWRDGPADALVPVAPLDTGASDADATAVFDETRDVGDAGGPTDATTEPESDTTDEPDPDATDESPPTADTTGDVAGDSLGARHPVPTRIRVFNADTGTCHFDNDAAPSPPAWSDESSARTDYRRNLRLFADPAAGTFRCYLNVCRHEPEQVIADVAVDRAPSEEFLAYCARAVARAIRSRDWTLYDTDEQLVFDTLRGATAVAPRWPYDDRETALLRDVESLAVVAPTQRAAVGVVDAVREWADGASLAVAGGDRDGATGDAAIRVRYTPRVSTVSVTGEGERRLVFARRDRARETVDETLAALADAVAGDRLPNVRAATWLNDALDDTPPSGRVRPSDRRLSTQLRRLLPTGVACLGLAVSVVLLVRPAAAVAALRREVSVAQLPAWFVTVGDATTSAPVWQLLVATLVPPAVTVVTLASPLALRRQVGAVRDVTRWLALRRDPPETAVEASREEFAAAVETVGRSTGDRVDDADTPLEERLAASSLQLTTRSTPDAATAPPSHTAVAVLTTATLTLSWLAVPVAGVLGRADAVASLLPFAVTVSLPVSWLAAVVALWRS